MSETTDPPSDERNSAGFWKLMRGYRRMFVNRTTLIVALQVIYVVTRIAMLVRRMLGDF